MSAETIEWLNTNVLVGFTAKRGKAWHYREESQGEEPNHYVGPVPVEDVQRRLFNFTVEERRVALELPVGPVLTKADLVKREDLTDEEKKALVGTRALEWVAQADQKAMCTSDDNTRLGLFKSGYQGHDYNEWLIDNVARLVSESNDEIAIGSAMLLRNRGVACVSIELNADNITTPEGVEFRPNLLAYTSYDGTKGTTFKEVVTNVVCDNTMRLAISEAGRAFKVKHTKNSHLRIGEAREALGIIFKVAEEFTAEVARLCAIDISPAQWARVKDIMVPVPTDPGMGRTMAENKRNRLDELQNWDSRCAQWTGSAYGVLQTFNTWNHHDSRVKGGANRFARNMDDVLSNKMSNKDNDVLAAIASVTS